MLTAQGTDGVSRGHPRERVSIGEAMLKICPWGKSAFERTPYLKPWVKSWTPSGTEFLTPKDSYSRGQDHSGCYFDQLFSTSEARKPKGFWRINTKPGTFIWSPPPIVADVALEQLRRARLKRRESLHIFIVPHLFTPMWYKQLSKACDIVFEITPTHPFWSSDMFEPVVFGICFPYIKHRPWQLRGTPKMLSLGRKMRVMFKSQDVDHRYILSQLLLECRQLSTMPASVVWRVLHFRPKSDLSGKEDRVLSERRGKRARSRRRETSRSLGPPTQKRR